MPRWHVQLALVAALLVATVAASPAYAGDRSGDDFFGQVSIGGVRGFNEDVRAGVIEVVLGGLDRPKPANDKVSGIGLHVALIAGPNDDDETYVLGQVGLELRTCLFHGIGCIYLGADLGNQRFNKNVDGNRQTNSDLVIVLPRVGVDWGVGQFRFRFSAELLLAKAERDDRNVSPMTDLDYRDALAATFTVGWRFLGK